MSIAELANFLGWCTLINFGILACAAASLLMIGKSVAKIHHRLFAIPPTDLPKAYFNYLANYKLLIIVFNLVPYLALRIMGTS